MNLNIVLLEPEIPQNTGNIVRTCAATGARLHLIKPLGFSLEDRYLKRAGLDYWSMADIFIYENIEEFYKKNGEKNCFYFSAKGSKNYVQMDFPDNCFLLFGRESVGLPEELLRENLEKCVRIPMLPGTRCLNVSNSVAVVVYDILRRGDFYGMQMEGMLKN